jgi:hypothetical protein
VLSATVKLTYTADRFSLWIVLNNSVGWYYDPLDETDVVLDAIDAALEDTNGRDGLNEPIIAMEPRNVALEMFCRFGDDFRFGV